MEKLDGELQVLKKALADQLEFYFLEDKVEDEFLVSVFLSPALRFLFKQYSMHESCAKKWWGGPTAGWPAGPQRWQTCRTVILQRMEKIMPSFKITISQAPVLTKILTQFLYQF